MEKLVHEMAQCEQWDKEKGSFKMLTDNESMPVILSGQALLEEMTTWKTSLGKQPGYWTKSTNLAIPLHMPTWLQHNGVETLRNE